MRVYGTAERGTSGGTHVPLPPPRRIPQRKPTPPSPIQLQDEPKILAPPKPKPAPKPRVRSHREAASGQAIAPEKVERIIELYKAGSTAKAAAEAVGCARPTALRYLREAGIEIRKGKREIDVEELRQAYASGRSMRDIGKQYGMSNTTVRKRLQEAGIEIRSQGSWRDFKEGGK